MARRFGSPIWLCCGGGSRRHLLFLGFRPGLLVGAFTQLPPVLRHVDHDVLPFEDVDRTGDVVEIALRPIRCEGCGGGLDDHATTVASTYAGVPSA